ncbi:MAG: T9SS type A sorting domain-containing protein [Bacteroidales bacterium]|nr:T9SS type A sorting domain-containing protein [Bacteroidales bacterium]MCF8391620.1 T9SS type A sorting domain-containing protein [Bacteroidales bacterium]
MIKKRLPLLQLFVVLFFTQAISAQITSISDIHGTGASSPLVGKTVNVEGAVTGVVSTGFFIRNDNSPRSGIYVYNPASSNKPLLGDTVSFTALVAEYYGLTELTTVTNFLIISTANPEPLPVELSTGDIDEDWEGCLVRITNAACTNTNLGYGEWEVNDGSGTVVINDLGVAYSPVADQIYGITGLVEYSFNFFKINPRTLSDIEIMASHYFTTDVYAEEIEKNSLLLSWETNTPVSTECLWGSNLENLTTIGNGELTESHQILLDNLQPASFYFILPYFVIEEDTVKMEAEVFATASESSGEIRVSFNRTLNNTEETGSPELYSSNLADSIIKYINQASETLDIALYDFTNHSSQSDTRNASIVEAINAAYLRGVDVRLITDANVSNDILDSLLLSEIHSLEASHAGIMHQKFIVADYQSIENSWIVTGSTNPNYNNLVLDYNNLIAIQDQSLAKAYHNEFNEMWGGSDLLPDLLESRFSADKTDNTPHYFSVSGKRVELYFSPSDHTTSKISDALQAAETSVDFAMMAFTEDVLGNSLVSDFNNQIRVRGIIDYVEYSGSEFDKLLNAGIEVYDFANSDGSGWPDASTLHHKFAIVDAGTANGTVITGSHNWTASAESRNDENTLIIHDQEISSLFLKEVERIEKQIFNNLSPVCVNDFLQSESALQYNYDILSNDSYNSAVILEITDSTKYGSLKIETDKSITYTPYQPEVLQIDSFSYTLSLVNNPFVSDTGIAVIENTYPVSVSSKTITNEIVRLYPNPAGDYINLHYEGEANPDLIQLLDITGKVVFETKEITNGYPLRIRSQNLDSGIYLVKIHTGDTIITRKIIKK